MQKGLFRRDLYYRLAVLRLSTPSLRQRGADDVAELARSMLARHLGLSSAQALEADPHRALADLLKAVLTHAVAHDWPGNVRELDNWVERLLACHADLTAADGALDAGRLQDIFPECAPLMPLAEPVAAARTRLRDTRREAERQRVREVLDSVDGDQSRACAILGISRATLWRRMKA